DVRTHPSGRDSRPSGSAAKSASVASLIVEAVIEGALCSLVGWAVKGTIGGRVTVFLGLNLAATGAVALLWFMAVIRRRLGEREDQFFATVFLSSGLACALLTIVAAVCVAAPTLVATPTVRNPPRS